MDRHSAYICKIFAVIRHISDKFLPQKAVTIYTLCVGTESYPVLGKRGLIITDISESELVSGVRRSGRKRIVNSKTIFDV